MMKEFLNMKKSKKNLIGIIVFFLYSIVSLTKGFPLQLFDITKLNENIILLYSLIVSILLVIIISLIYKSKLINNYKELKKKHQTYFSKYLKYWLISLFFMGLSNLIILSFVQDGLPTNEEMIRDIFNSSPILVFLSAVIVAPIIEELVFRQSFRDMFNDDAVFIFMSALTFASFHVVGTVTSPIDLIYIIPYAFPAIAFALMLKETNNIFVPMGFHFLHNGLLMAVQFAILIFGPY